MLVAPVRECSCVLVFDCNGLRETMYCLRVFCNAKRMSQVFTMGRLQHFSFLFQKWSWDTISKAMGRSGCAGRSCTNSIGSRGAFETVRGCLAAPCLICGRSASTGRYSLLETLSMSKRRRQKSRPLSLLLPFELGIVCTIEQLAMASG